MHCFDARHWISYSLLLLRVPYEFLRGGVESLLIIGNSKLVGTPSWWEPQVGGNSKLVGTPSWWELQVGGNWELQVSRNVVGMWWECGGNVVGMWWELVGTWRVRGAGSFFSK